MTESNREKLIKPSADPVPVIVVSPDPIVLSNEGRLSFAIIGLLFFSAIMIFLIGWGDSKNVLHTSALNWTFLADVGILGALGFAQLLALVPYFFSSKKAVDDPVKKAKV